MPLMVRSYVRRRCCAVLPLAGLLVLACCAAYTTQAFFIDFSFYPTRVAMRDMCAWTPTVDLSR